MDSGYHKKEILKWPKGLGHSPKEMNGYVYPISTNYGSISDRSFLIFKRATLKLVFGKFVFNTKYSKFQDLLK